MVVLVWVLSWGTLPCGTEKRSCRVQPLREAYGQGECLGGTWHGQMDVEGFMEEVCYCGPADMPTLAQQRMHLGASPTLLVLVARHISASGNEHGREMWQL